MIETGELKLPFGVTVTKALAIPPWKMRTAFVGNVAKEKSCVVEVTFTT